MKAPSVRLDLPTWTAAVWVDACRLAQTYLPLLGEDGDGLAAGWGADAFPAFGCVAGPGRAAAFWAAAAVFAARFPSGAVDLPPCLASEVALEAAAAAAAAAAAFILDSSFLDAWAASL